MRWRRFRASRSPVRIARARPAIDASGVSAETGVPAGTRSPHEISESSNSKVLRAMGSPDATHAPREISRPHARVSAVTIHSVVTSPGPTSSARKSRSFASRASPSRDFIVVTKDIRSGCGAAALRQFQHPQEWPLGGLADLFGDHDLGALVTQAKVELLDRVQLHEGALVAVAAIVRRYGD